MMTPVSHAAPPNGQLAQPRLPPDGKKFPPLSQGQPAALVSPDGVSGFFVYRLLLAVRCGKA